jgi:hypothetical protein
MGWAPRGTSHVCVWRAVESSGSAGGTRCSPLGECGHIATAGAIPPLWRRFGYKRRYPSRIAVTSGGLPLGRYLRGGCLEVAWPGSGRRAPGRAAARRRFFRYHRGCCGVGQPSCGGQKAVGASLSQLTYWRRSDAASPRTVPNPVRAWCRRWRGCASTHLTCIHPRAALKPTTICARRPHAFSLL